MNGRYGHSTVPSRRPQVVEKRDPSVCFFVVVSEYGEVMERERERDRESQSDTKRETNSGTVKDTYKLNAASFVSVRLLPTILY